MNPWSNVLSMECMHVVPCAPEPILPPLLYADRDDAREDAKCL